MGIFGAIWCILGQFKQFYRVLVNISRIAALQPVWRGFNRF